MAPDGRIDPSSAVTKSTMESAAVESTTTEAASVEASVSETALVQIPWMAAKLSVGVDWRIRQQAPRSTSLARFCSALEAYPMRTGLS